MASSWQARRDTAATPGRSVARHPRRVAVLRALNLGDLLCAVPAFRALRAAFPRAHVTLIGLAWARELQGRFAAYLDDFLELPGYPGLPEVPVRLDRLPACLREARRRRLDLVLQLHGAGTVTNGLVARLGARAGAGFFRQGEPCPDGDRFLPYPDDLPEVRRHLALLSFLGIPPAGEHLEFPLHFADHRVLSLVDPPLAPGSYACVHAGGRQDGRRWPPEHFARVADGLAGRGLRVVLTGTAAESAIAARVAGCMTAPAVDLTGRTSLGGLGALLRHAALLVSNDTGVAHLAQAVGAPSVILFDAGELERWGPLVRDRHRPLWPLARVSPGQALREADHLLHAVYGSPGPAGRAVN